MKVIVHLTKEEEAKALPILLRHSPGMVLPHRTYVLSENALRALRDANVRFSELSREAAAPSLEEVVGENLKKEFQQEEFLIIEREIGLL